MNWATDITLAFPEIILLAGACLLLVIDTFSRDSDRKLTYVLDQLILIVTALMSLYLATSETVYAFGNHFVSDPMSTVLKVIVCTVSFFVFLYSHEYLKKHEWMQGEYFILGLLAVLGMMVMISASSLLTVYLGLELLSLSLYAMVAMHKDSQPASEAAMKYFVLGALASGMLLYGISIFYGVTGTLELNQLSQVLASRGEQNTLLVFGLIFIVVGIAFKFGAVPFHMWVPDVYQGAPTAVTLFISSAPKVAAFAMAIRLLVNGMQPLLIDWQQMLVILAILSMATGNIIAIAQSNLKRMLAYSTILSGTEAGFAAAMFYVISYAIMSAGAFGIIILLSRKGFESDNLDDMKGLADRNPWFAFIMLILMFSMTGVPPFLGFWAKWFVLKEIVDMGYVWLAALAVVFSIIGAYYYLRVVKLMYFDKAESMTAIKASRQMRLALSINGLAILVIGLMPGSLMAVCLAALIK
jgi:NADH-quinone oxidoreductase subunit N